MRRAFIPVIFAAAASTALAQQPPQLAPLPEVPPPPRTPIEQGDEPRVRIAPQPGDRIEEVRDGGRVKVLKVTPASGAPYFLVDTTGNGNWMRRDSLDDGLRVPMWQIFTFD